MSISQIATPTELKRELEFRRSQEQVKWFLEKFYHIPVIGTGPALFELRDYQSEIIDVIETADLIVSLKARQIGMTTVTVGYAVWDAMFHDNHPWLLVSKNEGGAKKMLERAAYGYDRLPAWLKQRLPQITSRTQTVLEFDNGSRIEAVPSVSSTGRGDSVFGVILDEFAFMEYSSEVFAALEPLVYGKMIIISTANGMGDRFHEIWLESQKSDSPWHGIFYAWDVVPSRDQDWYDRKLLSFRGQEWYFYQEYPADPEEAFAKSGRTVFGPGVLEYLDWQEPVKFFEWDGDGGFHETSNPSAYALKVWAEPFVERDPEFGYVTQQPNYVIGVDVAEGLEHGDFTVVKVFDANTDTEVAVLHALFPLEDLDDFLYDLGQWYFWALIAVERNNQGIAVLVGLQKARYPRLYRSMSLARRQNTRSLDIGWVTSKQSKPKMITDFIAALRKQEPMLYDEAFLEESHTFVMDGKGSYAATPGKHDDNIMATLIAWQGVMEVGKYPHVWKDLRAKPLTFAEFFSLSEPKNKKGHPLDRPLGRDNVNYEPRRGFMLTEANKRKRPN